MTEVTDFDEIGAALYGVIALISRRVRHLQAPGDLTLPERVALARLSRGGPTSAADLARSEHISPQAVGVTLNSLETRGLVKRDTDPADGRRVLVSLTDAGAELVVYKSDARSLQFAKALASEFTATELHALATAVPLLARLGDRI
jgi:DNA-binding MarR family transcriptional regulator